MFWLLIWSKLISFPHILFGILLLNYSFFWISSRFLNQCIRIIFIIWFLNWFVLFIIIFDNINIKFWFWTFFTFSLRKIRQQIILLRILSIILFLFLILLDWVLNLWNFIRLCYIQMPMLFNLIWANIFDSWLII